MPQSPVSVLALRAESYSDLGSTEPENIRWESIPDGYRSYERTIRIGRGQADWDAAVSALRRWGVKTRSGFTVEPNPPLHGRVHLDDDFWLHLRIGPFSIREPVRIIAEVDQLNRCGFAYGTLVGHPVSGEEAFIVHRTNDDTVWFTLRSLTRPGTGAWRFAFLVTLVAQQWYRHRYMRSLRR